MNTLFEYVILLHPNEDTKNDTILIRKPKTYLAKNAEQVAMMASRLIPDQYEKNLDQIAILVRPFKRNNNFIINSGTAIVGNCLTLTNLGNITHTDCANDNTQSFKPYEIKTI